MMYAERAPGGALVFALILSALFLLPTGYGEAEKTVWALRDHFNVTIRDASFHYAVETAEWGLDVEGVGPVVDFSHSEIVLGDGTVISLAELNNGVATRTGYLH